MIFDSHAHYEDKKFDEDRVELLSSMRQNKIGKIINVGSTLQTCKKSIEFAEQYQEVYAAIGIHPSEIKSLKEDDITLLEEMLTHKKAVACGEIGLDYYWDKEEKIQELQKVWFYKQLELAKRLNKPVIIHSRDAAKDTQEILKDDRYKELQCVIHCYSYSKEMAEDFVKMGYYIGVGGVITFKNGRRLREAVAAVPIDRILVETDAPYMAPEPYRGKRNESKYIEQVIREIALIKEKSVEEIEQITYQNALNFYRIKE